MQKHCTFLVLILILVISSSCQAQTPVDTFAPSATPAPTHTQPPPSTVAATATVVPPPPTVTPSVPAGLYTMYAGPEGIWISKPDGTSLAKLTDLGIDRIDLRRVRSPMGDRMALIVQTEDGLDLVEVRIPGGETETIVHLYSITEDELIENPTSERAFTAYAIRDYDNLAWGPGGRYLAFVGAMDGPTSDLYLYDTESGEIKRLTDGDEVQAVFPTWSWDGEFILLYGVSWRGPFGGAILGHDHLDEVVSVRAATGEGFLLPVPKSVAFNFVGWQDERHYITYDSDETCYSQNLRSVDVVTGEATPLMEASFSSAIAYSPRGAFLFSSDADCPSSPGEGTFLLPDGGTTPVQLLDKKVYEVSWVPEIRAFYAYPEGFFSAEGIKVYEPPVYGKSYHPAISEDGHQAWEVIENRQGRVVLKVPGGDWQTILEGDVAALAWNFGTLTIVLRDGALYAASAPAFHPQMMGYMEGVNQIWVPLP